MLGIDGDEFLGATGDGNEYSSLIENVAEITLSKLIYSPSFSYTGELHIPWGLVLFGRKESIYFSTTVYYLKHSKAGLFFCISSAEYVFIHRQKGLLLSLSWIQASHYSPNIPDMFSILL